MSQFSVTQNQSIFDVCLQTYGSFDYLYKLINDNGIASIDTPLVSGQVIEWDENLITDKSLYQTLTAGNVRFETKFNEEMNENYTYLVDNFGNFLVDNFGNFITL